MTTVEEQLDRQKIGTQLHKRKTEDSKRNGLVKENNGVKESNGELKPAVEDNSSRHGDNSRVHYFGQPLIWRNIIAIGLYHVGVVYAYITFPYFQRPLTVLWGELNIVYKIITNSVKLPFEIKNTS